MKRVRCGSPFSSQYCRAIFSDASMASDPPLTTNTRAMFAGAWAMMSSAIVSCAVFVKKPVCA
jgi:hypothetical protein